MKTFTNRGAMLIFVSLTAVALFTVTIGPAAGALSVKACQLVTAGDVQRLLGGGYSQEALMNNPQMSTCGYNKSGEKQNVVSVLAKLEIDPAAKVLKAEQDLAKQHGAPILSAARLGQGAYVFGPVGSGDQERAYIAFGKGKIRVIISVVTNGSVNAIATRKLAEIAYSRLK